MIILFLVICYLVAVICMFVFLFSIEWKLIPVILTLSIALYLIAKIAQDFHTLYCCIHHINCKEVKKGEKEMNNELYLHFLNQDEAIKFFGDIGRKIDDMTDKPPLTTELVNDLYYEAFPKRSEEYSADELPYTILVKCEDGKIHGPSFIKWSNTEDSAPYGVTVEGTIKRNEDESSVDWDKVKRFLKIAEHKRLYRNLGKDKTIHRFPG